MKFILVLAIFGVSLSSQSQNFVETLDTIDGSQDYQLDFEKIEQRFKTKNRLVDALTKRIEDRISVYTTLWKAHNRIKLSQISESEKISRLEEISFYKIAALDAYEETQTYSSWVKNLTLEFMITYYQSIPHLELNNSELRFDIEEVGDIYEISDFLIFQMQHGQYQFNQLITLSIYIDTIISDAMSEMFLEAQEGFSDLDSANTPSVKKTPKAKKSSSGIQQ